MSLRARLSVYEEQFQEMHDFKSRYYELKARLDAQASQTLEDSAPRVVPLSQELSETREASATLLREREDAEYRLEQAQEQIQRLTEQKIKHECELVQLCKHIVPADGAKATCSSHAMAVGIAGADAPFLHALGDSSNRWDPGISYREWSAVYNDAATQRVGLFAFPAVAQQCWL